MRIRGYSGVGAGTGGSRAVWEAAAGRGPARVSSSHTAPLSIAFHRSPAEAISETRVDFASGEVKTVPRPSFLRAATRCFSASEYVAESCARRRRPSAGAVSLGGAGSRAGERLKPATVGPAGVGAS